MMSENVSVYNVIGKSLKTKKPVIITKGLKTDAEQVDISAGCRHSVERRHCFKFEFFQATSCGGLESLPIKSGHDIRQGLGDQFHESPIHEFL